MPNRSAEYMASVMVENKVVGEVEMVEVAFAVAATVTDQTGAGHLMWQVEAGVAQMFQLLTLRLSGLAQRRIYYMPVSRSMNIDVNQLHDLRMLWEECARCRSVLIVQPEHILSFKLMVVDHSLAIPGSIALAHSLLDSAIWLRSHSRDILDESDEILRVRYQVIYTIGLPEAMDDHPNWWLTMQCVLCRVRRHISGIADIFWEDITLEEGCENLSPRVRSIGACAMRALVDSIVEDALNGELVTCPQLSFLPPHFRSVAKAYVTEVLRSELGGAMGPQGL